MIKIICFGKIKEFYLTELIQDYLKRIQKYHKVEIIELKDENDLEKEANHALKYIADKDYLIALDRCGKEMSSIDFANKLETIFIENSTITFMIGSSEGLDQKILQRAKLVLSFSSMTFPHGLFRGILLEQIYRAFKIINHETYHK